MTHAPRSTRFPLLAAVLAIGLVPALASAEVVTRDAFNYPNGTVLSATAGSGWQAHSGAGAKLITVNGGSITLQQSTGSGEDINKRWFTPIATTVKSYASFNFRITSGQTFGATIDYFAHFRPAATDTNGFVARVFAGAPVTGTTYSIGVSAGSVPTQGPVVLWGTPLNFNQTYKVVTSYDPTNGESKLWIDPVNEASTSITSGPVVATANKPIESYAFRQASPSGTTATQVIDDLVVATNFDAVNRNPKGLPGLGPMGMMMTALMLLIGGGYYMMRRRVALG